MSQEEVEQQEDDRMHDEPSQPQIDPEDRVAQQYSDQSADSLSAGTHPSPAYEDEFGDKGAAVSLENRDPSPPVEGVARRLRKGNLKSGTSDALRKSRRVSFDPLALLLDASLEGELELVKKTALEVYL